MLHLKDLILSLTRAFDVTNEAIKTTQGGNLGDYSAIALIEAARLASVAVIPVDVGNDADFEITVDVDGNTIPDNMYVHQVVIILSVATIFRVRLFATAARSLASPLWFNYAFGAMDEDYGNDATGFWCLNRDTGRPNRLFGNVAVDAAGASAASFNIYILFNEGR